MADVSRRLYRSPIALLADLRVLLSRPAVWCSAARGAVDVAFRERLMLVVTAVNRCPYCSYAHSRQALLNGISQQEIELLQNLAFEGSPAHEVPALLYAQHWAERDASPEPEVRQQVRDLYGEPTFDKIELILRLIRVANLVGNGFHHLLGRLSLRQRGSSDAEDE